MDRNELLKMVLEAREELAKINAILDKVLVALAQEKKPEPSLGYVPNPAWRSPSVLDVFGKAANPDYTGPLLPWNGNIICDKSYDDNDLQRARSLLGPAFGQSGTDNTKYDYSAKYDEGKTRC